MVCYHALRSHAFGAEDGARLDADPRHPSRPRGRERSGPARRRHSRGAAANTGRSARVESGHPRLLHLTEERERQVQALGGHPARRRQRGAQRLDALGNASAKLVGQLERQEQPHARGRPHG